MRSVRGIPHSVQVRLQRLELPLLLALRLPELLELLLRLLAFPLRVFDLRLNAHQVRPLRNEALPTISATPTHMLARTHLSLERLLCGLDPLLLLHHAPPRPGLLATRLLESLLVLLLLLPQPDQGFVLLSDGLRVLVEGLLDVKQLVQNPPEDQVVLRREGLFETRTRTKKHERRTRSWQSCSNRSASPFCSLYCLISPIMPLRFVKLNVAFSVARSRASLAFS